MQTVKPGYFIRKWAAMLGWANEKLLTIILLVVLVFSSFVVLWPHMFVLVPVGKIGVLYRPLSGGVDLNLVLREGAHIIFPWNTAYQYDAQIKLKELNLELLTSDLLKTNVSVTFQYEVNINTLPLLHKYVGMDYLEKVIVPLVTKVTREKVALVSSKSAYTGDISVVANDIAITSDSLLIQQISPPGLSNVRLIRVSAVQLNSITLPANVQAAIDNKVVESENADAYKYKIQAARQEAERKVIEATGIRDFQNLVNSGMTENYLRYRGIQATETLASSTNAKTLIFGSGPSGLPLVLGNAVDGAAPASASATTAPATTAPAPATTPASKDPKAAADSQKAAATPAPVTTAAPDKK
ncbi:MAG: prohibitin family protein [Burkholderiaceae bacterium]|nr:prohibitin family protein [Burkholderiaceae bacterium]